MAWALIAYLFSWARPSNMRELEMLGGDEIGALLPKWKRHYALAHEPWFGFTMGLAESCTA